MRHHWLFYWLAVEVMGIGNIIEADYLAELAPDFAPTDFDNLPEGGVGLNSIKTGMDKVH
ncbi:MAG: hypothetical protein PHU14_11525 [Methylovulum sp.]|nr:hypothetical protein [Methylovulum sp.]